SSPGAPSPSRRTLQPFVVLQLWAGRPRTSMGGPGIGQQNRSRSGVRSPRVPAPEGLLGGPGLALGDLLLAHRAGVTARPHRCSGGRVPLDLHGGPTALTTGGHAPGTLAVRTAPEAALLAAGAAVGLLPVLLVALAGAGGPVAGRALDAGLGDLGG